MFWCDNISMIDSNDLIHQSDTGQQALFSAKIENMAMRNPDGLANVANQFGLDSSADWRQIRDGLTDSSWRDAGAEASRWRARADMLAAALDEAHAAAGGGDIADVQATVATVGIPRRW